MGDLVLAMFVSLDGYVEGPNGFAPPPWSEEVARDWSEVNLARAAHLVYGRVNFEFNKGFWTSSEAAGMGETAAINRLPKTVVSRTLAGDPGWNGKVATGELAAAIGALKARTDGEIFCFGGAGVAQSLMAAGLVDVWRLMITPALLGGGKRLFEGGQPPGTLTLASAKTLDVGALIVEYRKA